MFEGEWRVALPTVLQVVMTLTCTCWHVQYQISILKLSAVGIWLYICVHCQSQEYPHISFDGTILTNHSYVDLSLVNENNRNVSCHTDLATCCSSTQGTYRGDWYFPNGERLKFKDCSNCKIYEERDAQRVELRHRSNGNMSGVYRCETPTNTIEKGYVYVGLYHSGGMYTH